MSEMAQTSAARGGYARTRSRTGVPRAKRVTDVVGAGFGLILLAPVFAAISLLVRRDSPGAAFFKQPRVGLGGRPFVMYKFRTMTSASDPGVHRDYVSRYIRCENDLRNADGAYKLENDSRITPVGRVLRRTSLDELPQLINVLKGEMSLVGPRPPLSYEVELYTARHLGRLGVLPGMTGLWQVSGRNETTFEQMVELDLEYIERWSFWGDLWILARTVGTVVRGKGA